jgi:tetratricopeptide (TPR) repeat protein
MRRSVSVVGLAILLGWSGVGRAGIYSTAETPLGPRVDPGGIQPLPLELFRSALDDRIGLLRDPAAVTATEPPIPEATLKKRTEFLAKIESLQAKVKSGTATPEDHVNLSAYLIWLNRPREAVELLEPLARGEQRGNFVLLANLATAYELAGQPERVADYLQQARDNWPSEAPGFTKEQLKWFREVERYQLKLVLLRKAEAAKQPPGARHAAENVDNLFGEIDAPVHFAGDSGQYEAGKLAAKESAKLPPNALAIVQQLLLWFPNDTRLLWLMAELLNAQGQIQDADKVMQQCVDSRRYSAAALMEHRRVIQEALAPPPWRPTTQQLVVAGAALAVVALLGYFQLREFVRRRMS